MKKTVSKLINVLLIILIAYLAFQKFVVNKPTKRIDVNQLVIEDLNGNTVNWKDLEGKAVFLNFWASWCGPCMAEMPSIKSSVEHFDGQDVVYILANTESVADAKKVLGKEKYAGMPFYVLKSAGNVSINAIPLTYLIDSKGDVQKVHAGVSHWNTPVAQKKIKALLKD